MQEVPPSSVARLLLQFADLAKTPLLEEIWQHFPENMFLIRVEGGDDFVVEAANPAQRQTLGQPVEGRRLHDFLPGETAGQIGANYRRCIALDAPIRYEEHVTYRDAEGGERLGHWLTLLVPIHYQSAEVTHLFGISQNVTELRLAREALERQNLELEARVQARTAELCAANGELRALNVRLQRLASRDYLTGVYNRRQLEHLARRELRRIERQGGSLSLLMLDLDDFKQINDERGHVEGDAILRRVASTLFGKLRRTDLLGRYGGDEFVVVLPDTLQAEAAVIAERLRRAVEEATGTTVSLGVAEYRPGDRRLGEITARADRQLLGAKRSGRNRVAT